MLMGRSARYATINQTITDDKITRQIKILNELLKRKKKKKITAHYVYSSGVKHKAREPRLAWQRPCPH